MAALGHYHGMEPRFATLLSDYRFCEYRLRVMQRDPAFHRGSVAAVMARMERLAQEWPALSCYMSPSG